MTQPILYLDLASPYAYLAVERARSILERPVDLQPILLGAIFQRRGFGSWAHTEQRADGMAEVEERAQRYRLPPIVWPEGWPANSLAADRAAVWAKQRGAAEPFIRALYGLQFATGADIAIPDILRAAAREAGLNPEDLIEATARPDIKDALRQATDEAWQRGVRGVPSIGIGETIFYGDDKLEDAAVHLSAVPGR